MNGGTGVASWAEGGLAWKDRTIIMTDITTNDPMTELGSDGLRLPPPAIHTGSSADDAFRG